MVQISCSDDDGGSSQQDITPAVGTYSLIQLNISTAQDINEDGTASTNLLDELDCITGTLALNADSSWDLTTTQVGITSITGELFFAQYNGSTTSSGIWQLNGTQVILLEASSPNQSYSLNENRLTLNIGENLPGFQSIVYQR